MTFTYNMRTDYRPIPPGEQGLQSVTAEKFHLVTREKPKHLEGICFDKYDNMYFTSTYDGKAYRLDTVSYTHLDVYKRQSLYLFLFYHVCVKFVTLED